MKLRSDLSLPLGDAESFASEPSSVLAPALTFQWTAGRFDIADAGRGLWCALSSRTGDTDASIDRGTFVGLGAPKFRALLALRVTSPNDE